MTAVERAFLSKIGEVPSKFVFRGQADRSWKLHSAATRRLIRYFNDDESVAQEYYFSDMHLVYHRSVLLDPARKYGFGVDHGHKISDLQLLAKLQRFGAATGLLDFSRDPLVALWHACEGNDCDGKVFVLDLDNGTDFRRISSEEAVQSAEEIFCVSSKKSKRLYFETLVQEDKKAGEFQKDCVSVLGLPLIPADTVSSIVIKATDKPQIRKELEELFDFVRPALFADVQRFSAVNGAILPLPQIENPEFYRLRGNQCYLQGDYLGAVSHYDQSIEFAPDVGHLYFLRGNAKAEAGEFGGACEDYDVAIHCEEESTKDCEGNASGDPNKPLLWRFYYNRGNVKAELEDFNCALEDYDAAVRIGEQAGLRYSWFFLNRGNVNYLLHNYCDAMRDYEEAIRIGNEDALYNKGNLLVILGRFDEALQCYDASIKGGDRRSGVICNRNGVEAILTRIGGAGYIVRSPRHRDKTLRMIVEVSIRANDNTMYTEFYNFLGTNGNTGNTGGDGLPGGEGLPGGKGYKGKPGFVVVVKGEEW